MLSAVEKVRGYKKMIWRSLGLLLDKEIDMTAYPNHSSDSSA